MTRDEIGAILERRREGYRRRDAAALAIDYAEDCVVESPSGGVHRGPEDAERVLRRVFEALEASLQEEAVLIDGDRVAQVVTIEGKGIAAFLGLPATGRSFRVPGVFLYDFKDGKIVRERRIYDFTAMLVQTGLLKAKPAE